MIDPAYNVFATETQQSYIDAVNEHRTNKAAAKALGISRHALERAIRNIKNAAAKHGFSPDHDMTRQVPDGYLVKGVSTYYDKDGKPSGQWVKSTVDQDRMQILMRESFAAMSDELPRQKPIPVPKNTQENLANVYTLTDSHVGALAWHKENLEADWDLTIAESVLVNCFDHMIRSSPKAKVGIVAQLGDFLHSDGLKAITPMSGHLLDQDGRFAKVVATAIRILRKVVNLALERHEKVIVLMAEGNHDMASSVWLRMMFKAMYENEPRIEVIDSELPYYVYQHGKTMLCWHHGHQKKNAELPMLFAAQFPVMWGSTTKRYAHTGHRHHVEEKEHSGITVIQHSTLAARDAYAARGGWMAERQCTSITYHLEYGQVARNTVCPEMVE